VLTNGYLLFLIARFLTFEDMRAVLGDDVNLELIWRASLAECRATSSDRITFMDFKKIIKGQPKVPVTPGVSARRLSFTSPLSPPTLRRLTAGAAMLSAAVFEAAASDDDSSRREVPGEVSATRGSVTLSDISALVVEEDPHRYLKESRSQSHKEGSSKSTFWDEEEEPVVLPKFPVPAGQKIGESRRASSLIVKSPLYRHHIEMRHAVLEASHRFDQKMNDMESNESSPAPRASLIMKRGETLIKRPSKITNVGESQNVDAAVKRSGRAQRGTRTKTRSDIRGMM